MKKKNPKVKVMKQDSLVHVEFGCRMSHDSIGRMKLKPEAEAILSGLEISKKVFLINNLSDLEDLVEADVDWIRDKSILLHHGSVLEHFNITVYLETTRAVLQELSRHRISVSPTVKSTRYCLGSLVKAYKSYKEVLADKTHSGAAREFAWLNFYKIVHFSLFDHYSEEFIRLEAQSLLDKITELDKCGVPITNDTVKPLISEAWGTEGVYTMNLRAVIALLDLRMDKPAYEPFRVLARNIYRALKPEVKTLLGDKYAELDEDITAKREAFNNRTTL